MKRKKLTAMALSAAMVVGMLTGCGGNQTAAADDAGKSSAGEMGSGTAENENTEEKEEVSLRLIMYGDTTVRRDEFFKKDFHDAVLNDLNIDLTVEFLPWGSDTSTVSTMLASGEEFAVLNIVPTNDWASKGYLAEIEEAQIEEHCPDLLSVRGENNGLDCVKYNGAIYGIPLGSKPYSGRMQTFQVRNDILNAVGYDADEITTYETFMEALAAVHEAYPEMRINNNVSIINGLNAEISDQFLNVLDGVQFAYVDEKEEGDNVYSLFESEAFQNACKIAGEWVELGYISKDKLSNPTQGDADWASGNCFMTFGTPGGMVDTSLKGTVPEAEFKLVKIGDLPKLKTRDYDWGISISASDADHVDRWLDFFNWIYRDQDTYNFCIYGVEGVDWEYAKDGTIEKLVEDSFLDDWLLEAAEYTVYDSSISEEMIEEYESYDEGSQLSKTAGFTFDSTPVSSELASMTAVYTEYMEPLQTGLLDFEENYENAVSKLKDAGLDVYMEEYQRQFSEWYASNQ